MDSARYPKSSPHRLTRQAGRQANSTPRGFDFTRHVRLVCDDMIARLPPLQHIDLERVAISFSQTRKAVGHGLQATLTPMRFEGGRDYTIRRGRRIGVQRILHRNGKEMLYLLSFYLPRFLNRSLEEKLVTILHELWHISPRFDGDLRRLPGRCYVHSHSEREYDAAMEKLAQQWLAQQPPIEVYGFLRKSFDEIRRECGNVYGTRIPAPKLIPLDRVAGSDS